MAAVNDTATDSLDDIPDNISITFLPNYTNLADRIKKRGLNFFSQGYIHNTCIKIYSETKPKIKVSSKCWRSMRKSEKPHSLHIEILCDKITESYCTCKVGLTGHCSHVIGLIKSLQGFKLHNIKRIPNQLSCTSIPQQWHVPRGDKIYPVPLNHVVVAKPCESRKRKPVLCQVASTDIEQLTKASGTPLEYLLSPKRPLVTTKLGDVQLGSFLSYQTRNLRAFKPVTSDGCGDLSINKTAPIKLPQKYESLRQHYTITNPDKLECSTRMQADSADWHCARKNRLTASNFGQVLKRKSTPTEKMLSRLFQTKCIQAASLTYGKRNESKAKSNYLAQFPNRHIHECGLVINNEFPFLGATPDGKLCDSGQVGIIEIKCPYSARDLTVSDACSQLQDFFLQKDQNNTITLKTDHPHYAQIQGQLMITGCSFCDFVVFCPNESELFVQRVFPDIEFMERMLTVLSNFFENYSQPYLKSIARYMY